MDKVVLRAGGPSRGPGHDASDRPNLPLPYDHHLKQILGTAPRVRAAAASSAHISRFDGRRNLLERALDCAAVGRRCWHRVVGRQGLDVAVAVRHGVEVLGRRRQQRADPTPRGFSIGYSKSGATVLAVFTYEAEKQSRAPQTDAPGFRCVEVTGAALARRATAVAAAAGTTVLADFDGFLSIPTHVPTA